MLQHGDFDYPLPRLIHTILPTQNYNYRFEHFVATGVRSSLVFKFKLEVVTFWAMHFIQEWVSADYSSGSLLQRYCLRFQYISWSSTWLVFDGKNQTELGFFPAADRGLWCPLLNFQLCIKHLSSLSIEAAWTAFFCPGIEVRYHWHI